MSLREGAVHGAVRGAPLGSRSGLLASRITRRGGAPLSAGGAPTKKASTRLAFNVSELLQFFRPREGIHSALRAVGSHPALNPSCVPQLGARSRGVPRRTWSSVDSVQLAGLRPLPLEPSVTIPTQRPRASTTTAVFESLLSLRTKANQPAEVIPTGWRCILLSGRRDSLRGSQCQAKLGTAED